MKPLMLVLFSFFALYGFGQTSYVEKPEFYSDSSALSENISAVTRQSFHKMFGDVANARWHVIDDGFTVKFRQHDIDHHVFYNNRGKWKATIQYLPVEKLPRWVCSRVSSDFKGYSIFFTQYVRTPVGHTYIVKIEKGSEWKCVRICSDATEVMGEYVRK